MKRLLSLLVLTATLILTSLSSFAAAKKKHLSASTKKHLTITSVEILDITEEYDNSLLEISNISIEGLNLNPITGTINQVDLIVDKVINIGQKIWNVVDKGRPVANYSSSKATALPGNATRWDQLESWRTPKSKVMRVVYKNMYGIEVVRFTYRIILLYGGTVNGVGKYIGYASVEPLEMTVAYMYTFNAKASVEAVYNMGTGQNPLAGMILNVNWTIETILKKSTLTNTYTLDGLGNIATPAESLTLQ